MFSIFCLCVVFAPLPDTWFHNLIWHLDLVGGSFVVVPPCSVCVVVVPCFRAVMVFHGLNIVLVGFGCFALGFCFSLSTVDAFVAWCVEASSVISLSSSAWTLWYWSIVTVSGLAQVVGAGFGAFCVVSAAVGDLCCSAVGSFGFWVIFVDFPVVPAQAFLLPVVVPMVVRILGSKYVWMFGVVADSAIFGFIMVAAAATGWLP